MPVQDVVYIEVLRKLQLQATEPGKSGILLLEPGPYEFYIVNFDDGRPEREWVVLINDRNFGTPLVRLKSPDRGGSIEVTDKNGKAHFND